MGQNTYRRNQEEASVVVWQKAKERGVWGEAEGVVGAKMGVLLSLYCLGKEELPHQSHFSGGAWRVLTCALPRPVQCLC